MSDEIRICIQCLGCYNEGKHIFKWMNAGELRENLDDLNPCKKPQHEEYKMADIESYALMQEFGEYPDYPRLLVLIDLMDEYGEAFEAWLKFRYTIDLDKDEIIETFEREFVGQYSQKDYAQSHMEEYLRDLPYIVASNIDYNGVWKDLTHEGFWSHSTGSPNHNTYIFRG